MKQWLGDGHNQCPICKSYVSTDNLIPLYINSDSDKDPRYLIHNITFHRTLHHRRPPQNNTPNQQQVPPVHENIRQNFQQQNYQQQPGFFVLNILYSCFQNRIINRINRDFANFGLV